MSTVWVDPPTFTDTIDGANTYVLRQASEGVVSRWIVHLVSSSFSGSITVKGRLAGTDNAFVAIPYKDRYLNGAVGDDASVTTAITGTSVLDIDSTGLDVAIDCTTFTSGSMALTAMAAEG